MEGLMAEAVIFARIGRMTFYRGVQPGDARPVGGGGYNEENIGHELYNFDPEGDRVYGFFQPPSKARRIRLDKVVRGYKGESLEGVLIVFVSSRPDRKGQFIVGWYRNARLYRECREMPGKRVIPLAKGSRTRKEFANVMCEANVSDACLLPTAYRLHPIPRKKGAMGQSNVCYTLNHDGSPNNAEWIHGAVEYVQTYNKDNLLIDAAAEASPIALDALSDSLEGAAGFEQDKRIRDAIEDYSMACAKRFFKREGYSVEDKSRTESYDLLCIKNGINLFVEVKGTRSRGDSIALTAGEVNHVKRNANNSALLVVHSVRIRGGRKPKASGGSGFLLEPWNIDSAELKPRAYTHSVSRKSRKEIHF
jgi:hypothetical protein